MKKILHIIFRDKFTSGYINYMKIDMAQYEHIFFTEKDGFELKLCDNNNLYYVDDYKYLTKNSELLGIMKAVDKIVISGFYNSASSVRFWNKKLLKKTYIQFWGGDFYPFQNQEKGIKRKISRWICYRALKNVGGLVFLIDGEFEKFTKYTGIINNNFVAPMPNDPYNVVDYETFFKGNLKNHRVIVGNSATDTNQHEEVIQWLARYKEECTDMQVFCPLSYGDATYREKILNVGKELLGDKFVPLLDYMTEEQYVELLSTCSVGIFNNNRQQAMGNINALLYLGKKLYIRKDTSMWKVYNERNYKVFAAEDIATYSAEEFWNISDVFSETNHQVGIQYITNMKVSAKEAWNKVFEA